jgi:hypothetical protein
VLINPAAPSIVEDVPVDRVGAVDQYSTPTQELYAQALARLYRHWELTGAPFVPNPTVPEYYAACGLPPRSDGVVQCGVLVLSPTHHRDLLLNVYHHHEDQGGNLLGEMRFLSHELLEAGCVSWLDPRFNYPWTVYRALHFPFLLSAPGHPRAAEAITSALHDVYFLHCTGSPDEMRLARDEPPPSGAPRRKQRRGGQAASPDVAISAPVVLFLYARPETTRRVLEAIRLARPPRLLLVGDAPALDAPPELVERIAAARGLIDEIDWDCEVVTDLADQHQGLERRMVSGLNWAFDLVEEAIVLEDDCVPDPTFFRFCTELLDRYRHHSDVLAISGNDFSSDLHARPEHYRCSRYTLVWGWATWRRAWQRHDPAMSDWPRLRDSDWLEWLLGDAHAVAYWRHIFEQTHRGRTSWDYAWTFTCWRHAGLCIHPEVNLVTNVGFGSDATNTRDANSIFANLPTVPAEFPLQHPSELARDVEADELLEAVMYSGNLARLFTRIRRGREIASQRTRS